MNLRSQTPKTKNRAPQLQTAGLEQYVEKSGETLLYQPTTGGKLALSP